MWPRKGASNMAANGHFAESDQPLSVARPRFWQFRLEPCVHGPGSLVRLHRPVWMRWLVRSRRLYKCAHCGAVVFYGR